VGKAVIDTQLKAWGNSYGITVPKGIAEELGLEPGTPIHVTIQFEAARNDSSKLPKLNVPYRPTKEILDEED
jgi:bifunctional DNA-binding transcriptional regulator/antitoxin component of YhaV-PrlF toxin-antitoxin module